MVNSGNKGRQFERDICRQLSLWWTEGARDDIFWRTAASGARHTQRKKRGVSTHGQAGDVAATDPLGAPFLEKYHVEIKKGYNRCSVQDLLDQPSGGQVREWLVKAAQEAVMKKVLIIWKRDRRETIAILQEAGHDPTWGRLNLMLEIIQLQENFDGKTTASVCADRAAEKGGVPGGSPVAPDPVVPGEALRDGGNEHPISAQNARKWKQ